MKAKTNSERQESLRARRAIEGLAEVRGVYLPLAMHPKLKKIARQIVGASIPVAIEKSP